MSCSQSAQGRVPIGPRAGLRDLLSLYADAPLGFRAFLAHRWWHARLSTIEQYIPKKAVVLDLGCGDGIFANLMGIRSADRHVIALEKDARKAARARGRVANVVVEQRDVLGGELPKVDVVTVIDVLHHFSSYAEQEVALDAVTRLLPPGGILVLKEVTASYPIKYRLTRALDRIAYPRDRFFFRRHEEFHELLRARAYDVEFRDLSAHVPYAHVMFACRRPESVA